MASPWCPRLRHLADSVALKEPASSGAPADPAEPRKEGAAPAHPKADVAANGPAPALGKSELAYDLGPSQQADEDAWQQAAAIKEAPAAAETGGAPREGASAAATGGAIKKGNAAGARKKQQAWPGAVGSSYDWQASWKSTDGWSSNGGWQGGGWTGSDSRTAWPQSGPVGAGEEAPGWKESKRQQGKAAPVAKAVEAAGATAGAPGAEASPGEARGGKRGKKVERKEAGLRWVEKDVASAQPSKDKAADAEPDTQQGEAVDRDAGRRGKPRPILQWRVAGRNGGGGGGGDDEALGGRSSS